MSNFLETKNRYLQSIRNDKYYQYDIQKFEKVEMMEQKLGKDLCNFTVAEIIDMYIYFNTPSLQYLIVLNNFYKNYVAWCISEHLVFDSQNHFYEITTDVLLTCMNNSHRIKRYYTREQLILSLGELLNPCEKFCILATFEGLYKENYGEIYTLTINDFDFEKKTVTTCAGRTLTVSDALMHLAKESASTYTYTAYGDGRYNQLDYFQDDGTIIMKNVRRMQLTASMDQMYYAKRYGKLMHKITHNTGHLFTGKELVASGKLDMIKKLYKNGDYKSYEECILANYDDIAYRYGDIQSVKNYIILNNLG